MPLHQPQSLTNDEAYALTAYILSIDGIVKPDAVLDKTTLPQVKMPNRDGFCVSVLCPIWRGEAARGDLQLRTTLSPRTAVFFAASLAALFSSRALAAEAVDLELVIAADVSSSIDDREAALEREGAVSAFQESPTW